MENVSSPVTALGFIPTFSANQESDGDKTSFETAASSVNCFAEVVVTQNYSDISRCAFIFVVYGVYSFAKTVRKALQSIKLNSLIRKIKLQ